MDRNVPQERPLVCLVDSRDDGHHPMYAAVYAEVLRELGCDVWLAAPARLIAAMPPCVDTIDGAVSLAMKPWEPPGPPAVGPIRFETLAARRWESLGGFLDQASHAAGRYPDLVLLLWFDDFIAEILPLHAVESRIRCPFAGLWFQPPPRRPRTWREAAKRLLRVGRRYRVLRSRQCAGVLLLDASDSGHLPRFGRPPLLEVPEVSVSMLPEAEPDLVADIRRRAAGRSIFSLVGSLEGRKGILPFLQAANVAPVDEWFFVMAGKLQRQTLDPEAIRLLDRLTAGRDPRVLLVDGWLDDEVLNAIVACSSLVHVYYYDWLYSSNMICKAAACDVPAIGGVAGYIGRMIRDYRLGFTVKAPPDLAARFIPGFAAEVTAFRKTAAFREGCHRYRAANNPAALGSVLRRLMPGCRSANHSAAEAATVPVASVERPLHAG
jgi:glycosyltransferase involved in cell wall biosynthesis